MTTDNATADEMYNDDGFHVETHVHRDTGTLYNPEGYNHLGFDEEGFDKDGYDAYGYDFEGYDGEGYDAEGYDNNGYDCDGYDRDGFDSDGYDRDGIHCETGTAYNEDGFDREGNSVSSSFDDELDCYSTCPIQRCGYMFPDGWERMLLAGHEIEMYSNDVDIDDVNAVRRQLDKAYNKGRESSHRCCVAKHDGSLGEGGFEIATIPLTREDTYRIFRSFDVMNGHTNCSAWCHGDEVGHHIHVNAAPLSAYTIGKLGVFMNLPDNRDFICAVAQRNAYYNTFEQNKKFGTRTADGRVVPHRNRNRHSVLNTGNGDTVEFRLFKSNLRTTGILKNYEFAISSIRFCQWASHSDLTWQNYVRWLGRNRSEYEYLVQFLLSHNVYRALLRSSMEQNAVAKYSKAASSTRAPVVA